MKNEDFDKIKYIHLRYTDPETDQIANQGGITVAYKSTLHQPKDSSLNDINLEIAFAICSNYDNFNKKIGRNIATNRLLNKAPQWYITEYYSTETIEDYAETTISDVLDLCLLSEPVIFSPWDPYYESTMSTVC